MRILALASFLTCLALNSCNDIKTIESSYVNELGYRPLRIQGEVTKLYTQDYISTDINRITWPNGLKATFQKDSSLYLIKGRMKQPLGHVTFHTDDGDFSLIIRQDYLQEIQIEYDGKEKNDSIYVFGSFNNWNRTSMPMSYSKLPDSPKGRHVLNLNLSAGQFEFKFYVNGREEIIPKNSYDIVSNGMGGYNHQLIVKEETKPCQPLRALSIIDLQISGLKRQNVRIDSLPEDQIVHALWNTSLIPKKSIQRNKNGELWVELPEKDKWGDRNHLHLYSQNESQISNDILIPFDKRDVIRSTTKLNRQDWEASTLYFLMVDRFSNGNYMNDRPLNQSDVIPIADYMGGDLEGLINILDSGYFENFGFNTVWLSPIGRNPEGAWGLWDKGGVKSKFSGYHGYWPISSVLPDSRLASKKSIKKLLNSAHSKDLNVLVDYVANHIHLDHPVYKKHPEWTTSLYLEDGSLNTEKWDSHRLTTWFDTHLPTLDLRRPEVVNPMTDSALVWVRDYGFDGYRHDATKHVDVLFWRTLTKKIKTEVNTDKRKRIFQIGETYGSPDLISSYIGPGLLDAQFDFNLYDAAVNFFADLSGDATQLMGVLETSLKTYGFHHLMGNISGNQDRPRFISIAGKEINPQEDTKLAGYTREIGAGDSISYYKLALLHAFNHSIPGVPVIYYGDEYGMPGANDPDNRRMMKFNGYNSSEIALRNTVQNIVKARRQNMALNFGFTEVQAPRKDVLYIIRSYLDTKVEIILNNGPNSFTKKITSPRKVIAGKGELGINQIVIPPYGFVYLAS